MRRKFRADIQFLRSLAIGFVLLNHLAADAFPGGYIGVDIFFVISGYLIIGHITDAVRAGKFSFKNFYIKRAWRLLPAAWFTIVITFIALLFLVPAYQSGDQRSSFIASWFYYENFHLMNAGTNYFSGIKHFAIYEHFWSLAVEEQFYIVMPIVLFFTYKFSKRTKFKEYSFEIILTLATVLSFAYALYLMRYQQAPANYFNPFSRIWEFTVGGLIYLIPQFTKWVRFNVLVIYSCYILLLVSLFLLNPNFVFPGPATLIPVLATAAIIYFGSANPDRPFENWRFFQYIGAISYPLYLWHLAVFLLLPYSGIPVISEVNEHNRLTLPGMIAALLISVGLAHITHYGLEKPLQKRGAALQKLPITLVALALSSTAVVGLYQAQPKIVENIQANQINKFQETNKSCGSGDPMKDIEANCPSTTFTEPVSPTEPGSIGKQWQDAGCHVEGSDTFLSGDCQFGEPGKYDLFVTGDSHSSQWSPAFIELAKQQHWNINFFSFYACPFVDLDGVTSIFTDAEKDTIYENTHRCQDQNKIATDFIQDKKPTHVVVSNFTRNTTLTRDNVVTVPTDEGNRTLTRDLDGQPWVKYSPNAMQGYKADSDALLAQLVQQRAQFVLDNSQTLTYIKDQPGDSERLSPRCIDFNLKTPGNCKAPVTEVQTDDAQYDAAKALNMQGLSTLNFDNFVCGEFCHGAVNGQRTFYDTNHLNTDFVKTFTNPLVSQLKDAINSGDAAPVGSSSQ